MATLTDSLPQTAETKARKLAMVRASLERVRAGKVQLSEKAAQMLEELRKEDSDLGGLVATVENSKARTTDEEFVADLANGDDAEGETKFAQGDDGENLTVISSAMASTSAPEKRKKHVSKWRIRSLADWQAMHV